MIKTLSNKCKSSTTSQFDSIFFIFICLKRNYASDAKYIFAFLTKRENERGAALKIKKVTI